MKYRLVKVTNPKFLGPYWSIQVKHFGLFWSEVDYTFLSEMEGNIRYRNVILSKNSVKKEVIKECTS